MMDYRIFDRKGNYIGVAEMTPEQARKAERDFIVKEA